MTAYPTDPNKAIDAKGAFEIGADWGQNYTESTIRSMFQVPAFNAFNALDVMRQQLMSMPIEVLKLFQSIVPVPLDFANGIGAAVESILAALSAPIRFLMEIDWQSWLSGTFNTFQNIVNQVMDILRGLIVTPINAAVQQIKDWWTNLTGQVQHLTPTGGFDAAQLIGQVATNTVAGLTNFFDGVYYALTGNTGTGSYVDPVEQLQYLVDTVTGHTQAITELQAANNGSENGGIVGGDNFQTPYTGNPGPGWAVYSTDSNTTYLGTDNGKLEYTNQGNTTPLVTAQRIDPADAKTLTEFQKITITASTPTAGDDAENRVYGRLSPDRTHYVVAYHKNNTIYIAYAAGGAETVVDSGPMPTGLMLSAGQRFALECGTDEGRDEYRVTIGGANGQSWKDTTGLVTTSANYAARGLSESPKGWMLGFRGAWHNPFPWSYWYSSPAAIANVTVADNIPVEIQGHGFRVYREATTNSANFSTGTRLAQYYDTIDYISPGSAWGVNGYVIPKSGHWSFSWRTYRSGSAWGQLSVALTVNNVSKAVGQLALNMNIEQSSVIVYCEKGDVVTPTAAILAGDPASMAGSSSGIDSHFSGALMSG